MDDNIHHLYEQYSTLNFKSFNISEYNRCDFENETDTNNNFYSNNYIYKM